MKKHVESRWLSIDCSLVRILEQMENLRDCFLKEIPKQKGFNQKNGLANDDLYKAESQKTKSRNLHVLCCFHFTVFQLFSQALADVFANDSSNLPHVSAIG